MRQPTATRGLSLNKSLSTLLLGAATAAYRPAPKPGSQGREILEEASLGQEFDRLVEQSVILTDGVAAG